MIHETVKTVALVGYMTAQVGNSLALPLCIYKLTVNLIKISTKHLCSVAHDKHFRQTKLPPQNRNLPRFKYS